MGDVRCVSADLEPARIGASDCERIREGFLAQPVNTVTSVSYVVAGAVTLARHHHGGSAQRRDVRLYSAVLALVGVGSVAFHGPQPPGARAMHDLPILALLAVALGTPALRLRRGEAVLPGWTPRRGGALVVGTLAGLSAYAGGRTGSPLCAPDSVVQLHGAWHALSAATFVGVADVIFGTVDDA